MLNNKVKELALKLHSFPSDERQWVLNNLNVTEMQMMEELLAELDSIDNASNKALISNLFSGNSELGNLGNGTKVSKELSGLIKILDNKSAESIFKQLKNEKVWVIALVLGVYDWRWKESYLGLINPGTKIHIRSCQKNVMSSARDIVKHTILSTLVDSLGDSMFSDENHSRNSFDLSNEKTDKEYDINKSWWSRLWG